jgi:hypothetical protein
LAIEYIALMKIVVESVQQKRKERDFGSMKQGVGITM